MNGTMVRRSVVRAATIAVIAALMTYVVLATVTTYRGVKFTSLKRPSKGVFLIVRNSECACLAGLSFEFEHVQISRFN